MCSMYVCICVDMLTNVHTYGYATYTTVPSKRRVKKVHMPLHTYLVYLCGLTRHHSGAEDW